ncbi:hypothetical protein [Lentzea sp. NPDC051838]|uniref:hypothetical protein n=1 Tax=Lentzea sp. NPDC051838 TaxID=3154849 RepID=UPI0034269826
MGAQPVLFGPGQPPATGGVGVDGGFGLVVVGSGFAVEEFELDGAALLLEAGVEDAVVSELEAVVGLPSSAALPA